MQSVLRVVVRVDWTSECLVGFNCHSIDDHCFALYDVVHTMPTLYTHCLSNVKVWSPDLKIGASANG